MLTRVNGLVRGQTTSYAERRVALGGGSGRARSAQGKPSGDRGDTLAAARSMSLTGTLLVAQDETPQGPSHIAPIAMQLFDARARGAEKDHTATASTSTTASHRYKDRLLYHDYYGNY